MYSFGSGPKVVFGGTRESGLKGPRSGANRSSNRSPSLAKADQTNGRINCGGAPRGGFQTHC